MSQDFLKLNWKKEYNRPGTLQLTIAYSWCLHKNLKKFIGRNYLNYLSIVRSNSLEWCQLDSEKQNNHDYFLKVLLNNAKFLKNNNRQVLKELQRLEKAFIGLGKADFASLKTSELIEKYRQFCRLRVELYIPISVILIEPAVNQKALELFNKYKLDHFEAVETITAPTKPNHLAKEQIELLKIAASKKDRAVKLKAHYLKYRYLPCYDINVKPFNFGYFYKRLKAWKVSLARLELKKVEKTFMANKLRFQKFITKHHFKGNDLLLIKYLQGFAWLKDYRSHFRSICNFRTLGLHQAIAERSRLSLNNLLKMTEPEVINLLKTGRQPDLKKRQNDFIYLKIGTQEHIITGQRAKEAIERLTGNKNQRRISGMGVGSGKAKARARLIMNPNEIDSLKAGEILVTSMTRPDYLAAMHKAAAIVTDEGGLLCHAAIVARELNKPCIVGTKIATKVLKNGDMVEVDSYKGIVKKLK